MRLSPLSLLLLLAGCAPAGPRGFGGPELLPAPEALSVPGVPVLPGFSTAVKTGPTLYLSGQVPLDSAGQLVGAGSLPLQAAQVFRNVAKVIRAAHGVPADLVRLTVYVVNYDSTTVAVVQEALAPYLEPTLTPAVTLVGVNSLPQPGMRIAVDGIAYVRGLLPDRARDHGP